LEILRETNDVLGKISSAEPVPRPGLSHKDLRDLIFPGETHHRLSNIAAVKNAGFDLEASREAKMFFYRLSFLGW
jgi:hypothetical protein